MAKKKCIVFDCEFLNSARGMCKTHYGAWLRENNGRVANPIHGPSVQLGEDEYDDYWLWVKKELRLA